tara:strand:- start:120 stop:428 length:309 start_codon:yes stop_codon:yes gene_type:complete
MIALDILLTTFVLLALFVAGSFIKQQYKTRKYTKLLDKYRKEYASYSVEEIDNVYNIEEYRNRKKEKMGDDVFEYSDTHNLVWSEESEKYVRTPKNIPIEDE